MAIKGSLKEASLADVCQLLAMGQKTGCLSVTDRSRFGQIFFERGRITFATVLNRRDRLGDLLVADGLVTHEQLRQAVEQQEREPDVRLGELLVRSGVVTAEQIERHVRMQIEEAVYHLFTWSRGSFYFEVDQRPGAAELLLAINPESILLEGARRVDEWSLIEKKIHSLDLIFQVERSRLEAAGVELTPEQTRLVPLLDGTRSVQELIEQTGMAEFEAGKALYGLIQAGFAHQVGRRADRSAARGVEAETAEHRNLGVAFYRTGMLEEAEAEFQRVLEADRRDPVARHHLALLAARQGQPKEAVRRFKKLLEELGPKAGAFANLGYALSRAGRHADALLVYDRADQLRPGSPRVALLRAWTLLSASRADEAVASAGEYRRRLPAGQPPAAAYYHLVALAAAAAGRLQDADAAAQEGLKAHPSAAPLLLLAGSIAERRGDLAAAERLCRQAAEEDPGLVQAHKSLGDIAYRLGFYDDASEHFQRAVNLAPDLGDDVYAKLGNLAFKRRDAAEAMRLWRRALQLNPENRVVRTNLQAAVQADG